MEYSNGSMALDFVSRGGGRGRGAVEGAKQSEVFELFLDLIELFYDLMYFSIQWGIFDAKTHHNNSDNYFILFNSVTTCTRVYSMFDFDEHM